MNDDSKFCKKCGSRLEGFRCPVCDYHPSAYGNSTPSMKSNPFAGPLIILLIVGYASYGIITSAINGYKSFMETYQKVNQSTDNTYQELDITYTGYFEINDLSYVDLGDYAREVDNGNNIITIPIDVTNNTGHPLFHNGDSMVNIYYNGEKVEPYDNGSLDSFTREAYITSYRTDRKFLNISDLGTGEVRIEFFDKNHKYYLYLTV